METVKKRLEFIPLDLINLKAIHKIGDRVYIPNLKAHGTVYGVEFIPDNPESPSSGGWWWYKVRTDKVDKTSFTCYDLPEEKLVAYSSLAE